MGSIPISATIMAYRNKADQAASSRRHYEKNKAAMKRRAAKHSAEERRRCRDVIVAAKNRPCADCGREYPSYVMDFDHVRGDKEHNVGDMANRGATVRRVLQEIEKCDVVCANCHRIRTHTRNQHRSRHSVARMPGCLPENEGSIPFATAKFDFGD